MSESNPTQPAPPIPPKPVEAAKVQPKKETVRINLPPKPTASPTIKIPAPAAVSSSAHVASGGSAAPAAAPAAAASSAASRPAPIASGGPQRAMAPSRSAGAIAATSGVDKGLGIAALVIVLAVIGRLLTLFPSS